MPRSDTTKGRILAAALAEFSMKGFSGGRMEQIARGAGINKALLFYHFSSKENLYREVLKQTVKQIAPRIRSIALKENDPESLLETLPPIYIRFFADNREFIRMVTFDFVQHNEMIKTALSEGIGGELAIGPRLILKKIRRWYERGEIREKNPLHFMINIISLCLFAFIARPLIEAIFSTDLDNEAFVRERIKSVTEILKRGMLP